MSLIIKLWQRTIKQPIDIWFFFGFLFTFTLSIRKVTSHLPLKGTFNEYAGIYIYLSDIFLVLTIISWIVSLIYNNNTTLSSYKLVKLWIKNNTNNLYLLIPLIIVIWSFISIIWSENQLIALFRSIKLLELYLLYLYLILRFIPKYLPELSNYVKNVPRGTFQLFSVIIIFSGLIQSIIGIAQFIFQRSIGIQILKESILNTDMPGVAKIILDGDKYIRAYGLMPHPNILGGLLLFSIIISLLCYKLFCSCPVGVNCSTWNNSGLYSKEQFKSISTSNKSYILNKIWHSNAKWLLKALILIQSLALVLTFSKSAILALIISIIYILLKTINNNQLDNNFMIQECQPLNEINVPRGTFIKNSKIIQCSTWNISNYINFYYFRILTLTLIIFTLSFFIFLKPSMHSIFTQPIVERIFYLNVSRGTIYENPLLGIGSGQFVLNLSHFDENVISIWQYQPIHNIFLLIWAELGFIGLVIFSWWLWKLFRNKENKSVMPNKKDDHSVTEKIKLFHPIKSQNVPRGTFYSYGASLENFVTSHNEVLSSQKTNVEQSLGSKNNLLILNNNIIILSSFLIIVYFKAILLGFIFIMLFDHYLWDIWPGQVLFWLTAGIIAGINRKC